MRTKITRGGSSGTAVKLGWTFLGLCCVGLLGYAFHRGVRVGKHISYTLDEPAYECTDVRCSLVPGYKLYCTYLTSSGTFREGGSLVYTTYDEADEHGYCPMLRS